MAASRFDTIRPNAAAHLFPVGFAGSSRFVGRISRAGMDQHQRIHDSRLAGLSLFAWFVKVAELVMPAAHESLAWTFGWFLRIAIGVNAIFYFAVFALPAYLVDRQYSRSS